MLRVYYIKVAQYITQSPSHIFHTLAFTHSPTESSVHPTDLTLFALGARAYCQLGHDRVCARVGATRDEPLGPVCMGTQQQVDTSYKKQQRCSHLKIITVALTSPSSIQITIMTTISRLLQKLMSGFWPHSRKKLRQLRFPENLS